MEAAVGVSVVNEAVFAQRPYQPGFARSYFILDQALQGEGVSLPDAPLSAALDNRSRQDLQEAQQLTAKASWALYQGQDYSLNEQSVDETSRAGVNSQRVQAFSLLSLLISLTLILVSILIAFIVVRGLRRTGVLGTAAGRLLLTLLVLAVVGAALLIGTQRIIDLLTPENTGLLLALTYIGGETAQLALGLPAAAIQAFQGMLLFFLLAFDLLVNFRIRMGRVAA